LKSTWRKPSTIGSKPFFTFSCPVAAIPQRRPWNDRRRQDFVAAFVAPNFWPACKAFVRFRAAIKKNSDRGRSA